MVARLDNVSPRLTWLLRSLSGGPASTYDQQLELAKVYDALMRRKQRLDENNNDANRRSREFSWKSLLNQINQDGYTVDSLEVKVGKAHYEKFLDAVKALLGDDNDQYILADLAQQLFTSVVNHGNNLDSKRVASDLSRLIGDVKLHNVETAINAAHGIASWFKKELQKAQNREEKEQQQSAAREFGADIRFNIPPAESLIQMQQKQQQQQQQEQRRLEQQRQREQQKAADAAARESSTGLIDSKPKKVSIDWLADQCERLLGNYEIAENVLKILEQSKDDVQTQAQLFDLLGVNALDMIPTILENKHKLLKQYLTYKLDDYDRAKPVPGQQFTIKSNMEIMLEKKRRKEERAYLKQQQQEFQKEEEDRELKRLEMLGLDRVERMRGKQKSSKKGIVLHLEFEEEDRKDVPPRLTTADVHLPRGTQRHFFDGWEEVHIPPVIPEPPREEELVPITEFDEWARVAFPGVKYLNRIQSRLFHAAYKSNENLLICAPTGAGKTNCAMMTILHEIGLHIRDGILRRDEFKIVYIAPMKALAQEMVENFSRRLRALGITVKELTGDMQLSKKEIQATQIIVTTPEKWDVITRKTADGSLASLVKLIIIDEVHLLHEDRGPVIEAIVARTIRQVETTQSMIRIVGLSATLPNYEDVAQFLRVNPTTGLFHFDNSYRPVPLTQQYIGVSDKNMMRMLQLYNEICYDKVVENLREGHQVMVFVHSRKETATTGRILREMALERGDIELFAIKDVLPWAAKEVSRSKNATVRELYESGISIHHAGMLRADRSLVERLFADSQIRVLICTATLAWGVNLPAHTVIIKGTQVYDAKKGQPVELNMLDVMQIFGRAGRPQFDTSGLGIIITSQKQLPRYLSLMNHALPIESQMLDHLPDHLNAEVVLGTVTNLREALQWVSYTYLYIRLLKNPMAYGILYEEKLMDPLLGGHRRKLVVNAAKKLDECKMIRFNEKAGTLAVTDLGRVASHYYIEHQTIMTYNEGLDRNMSESEILKLIAMSHEFENVKQRDDEMEELTNLMNEWCPVPVKGGVENQYGKINILLQAYISQAKVKNFALVSDSMYVVQSAGRIARGLFEIVIRRGWNSMAEKLLMLAKCIDQRMWAFHHPLRQFPTLLSLDIVQKLEAKNATLDKLADMSDKEIGNLINNYRYGSLVAKCVSHFPSLALEAEIQPITRTVLRVQLSITPTFEWNDRLHGSALPWWIWVEDAENEHIYHSEYFVLQRNALETQKLNFTIPVFEPLPPQYFIRAISDRYLGCETTLPISFKDLILPERHPPHTELLNLLPLPVTALHNEQYQQLYKFTHFNPVQTQIFHTLYHTDCNVLMGAPTGSGKTIIAEIAILRLFNEVPDGKVVYVGPLKALVRERMDDWSVRFGQRLGKKVVELTGDVTPDIRLLQQADIVLTTPEKWDGISRNWQQRSYVKKVGLVILDEIHLLGQDRGPILEVIVSRMRYISWYTGRNIRIVGLSTALANARDLADWLGIEQRGLYNFKPSVRPVALEVHIQGFPGRHYCPRMATMNKPAYAAIQMYSPTKPVLIFVSSRRQTRLTAVDLISYCAGDENPRKFLKMDEMELENILATVVDANLRHTLTFGIGMHHAGLCDTDKKLVEHLFVTEKIQVLIATSTLAWGVNFPAHLVVIKGTEFFDPKTKRYEDYPITDVLQMMGRAGRPQFDNEGVAVIMVHEPKKNFYKKFLYEPFPVESSLQNHLHDHINAEIVGGTIGCCQDAVDYLTWTYLFRRLVQNPSYYGVEDGSYEGLTRYLSNLVERVISDLSDAGCITLREVVSDGDGNGNGDPSGVVTPTILGRIASYYYLSYVTARLFSNRLQSALDVPSLLQLLCDAKEFEELPVRHNEDKINAELSHAVPMPVTDYLLMESPHTKAYLLLQSHFSRIDLPISDYITDTKTVLDQSIRVIQAMVDIAAEKGYLTTALRTMQLLQMIMQARWHTDSSLLCLPHLTQDHVAKLAQKDVVCLPQLCEMSRKQIQDLLSGVGLPGDRVESICNVCERLPRIDVNLVSTKVNHEQDEGIVTVELVRKSKLQKHAYAPKYTKNKEEGWWLVIGNQSGELLALKRVNLHERTKTTLSVAGVSSQSAAPLTLYFMSDSYIGFDQQYDVSFSAEAKAKPEAEAEAEAASAHKHKQQE
eukprot:GEZU01042062.1.p1 GENE.GEZU01042062.1~~GEZU01042062.1.p1  ORF type:complete len:2174 (-),score=564.16 GEZU01042062.1:67-6525(-)